MLFKDADKIKEYAELTGINDLTALTATLTFVEEQHILPVLDKALYATLQDAYAAAAANEVLTPTTLNPLLEKCRRVAAPFLCYYYAPKADVKLSDSGAQRVETGSNKTAYQYQTTNFREANLREAEAQLEALISFLEDKKTVYTQWTASDSYRRYRSLFIKSGKEFEALYTSHTPYRNYYIMRNKMQDVEENNIRQLLGDELYDTFKSTYTGITALSDKEQQLLGKIQKIIAYLTVAFSIPFLNVRIEGAGLSVIAPATFSTNDKDNTRAGADGAAKKELTAACMAGAEIWISNTIKFLTANKTDFPTWIGFAVPAAPAPYCDDLKGTFGLT